MTDGICQFFPGRLLPPRQAPQLIDDTHESTHQRSSAPFWKAKKLRYTNSTLDRRRGLTLSIARPVQASPAFLLRRRTNPPWRAPGSAQFQPFSFLSRRSLADVGRSSHSLVSRLALRYPRGVTVHVAPFLPLNSKVASIPAPPSPTERLGNRESIRCCVCGNKATDCSARARKEINRFHYIRRIALRIR